MSKLDHFIFIICLIFNNRSVSDGTLELYTVHKFKDDVPFSHV